MFDHIGKDPIDVREIIAILNIFNQELYPIKDNGHVGGTQPIQSYTGKEVSLKKFLSLGKEDSPEYLGKSNNLWSNLFKEVIIHIYLS